MVQCSLPLSEGEGRELMINWSPNELTAEFRMRTLDSSRAFLHVVFNS